MIFSKVAVLTAVSSVVAVEGANAVTSPDQNQLFTPLTCRPSSMVQADPYPSGFIDRVSDYVVDVLGRTFSSPYEAAKAAVRQRFVYVTSSKRVPVASTMTDQYRNLAKEHMAKDKPFEVARRSVSKWVEQAGRFLIGIPTFMAFHQAVPHPENHMYIMPEMHATIMRQHLDASWHNKQATNDDGEDIPQ